MKIIFICGSLEPGKDGVGDYTRRLCGELLKQGVMVGMLAYNDKHLHYKMETIQESDGHTIPSLRLPHTWKSKVRCKEAKNWIASHNPEWLSLQFVPYAFHHKGLPFGLGNQLKRMGTNYKWHIMIHELWIGMSQQSTLKDKCIGQVQRIIIKKLLLKLVPKVIHTQTDLYKHHLQQLEFEASILPLFSNISYVESDFHTNKSIAEFNLPEKYLVLFGSIHKNAPIEEFVKELSELDKEKTFSFVALGRNGGELQYWKSIIEKYGFDIMVLGEQSAESISYVLSHATFGMATTPYYLIEKSGSVAAMHQHNLPVICLSKPWMPNKFIRSNKLKGVEEYKTGNLEACIANDTKMETGDISISNITISFLKTLN
ncbi:MAG: hypothetical protein ACM31G_11070 [Flavobacteriales bacterium]